MGWGVNIGLRVAWSVRVSDVQDRAQEQKQRLWLASDSVCSKRLESSTAGGICAMDHCCDCQRAWMNKWGVPQCLWIIFFLTRCLSQEKSQGSSYRRPTAVLRACFFNLTPFKLNPFAKMLVMNLFAHPCTQSVLAESTLGLLLVVGSMDCSATEELQNFRNHKKI